MRNLIVILMLALFANTSFAATGSGNITNAIGLGGFADSTVLDSIFLPSTNPTQYYTLNTNVSATANNYYIAYKNGVAYQVTAGKTFVATKMCFLADAVNVTAGIITATASFANNASSITGGVYQGGVASTYPLKGSTAANTWRCYNTTFSAAASTFVGMQLGNSNNYIIHIYGTEI